MILAYRCADCKRPSVAVDVKVVIEPALCALCCDLRLVLYDYATYVTMVDPFNALGRAVLAWAMEF